ncbi:tumor necrosis factor ligand superfamily member 14-like isoform X1 [Labrus bergylta]|nr:tumor necrosis factor ligand superfamily member 14-like isoform X1 [Labrus bergylta]
MSLKSVSLSVFLHRPLTIGPNVPGGAAPGGMAEACVASRPQVFVVDSQASYVSAPVGKKRRWEKVGQKCLLMLLGLVVFGLVVQGCLIHNLYQKTEAFSLCRSHPLCQNLSDPGSYPPSSGLQDGIILSRVGSEASNQISSMDQTEEVQQRPFAHLTGSSKTVDQHHVVQWMTNVGETITHKMGYEDGRLLVEEEGFYYLYSKVTIGAEEDCLFFQHEVLKDIKAYGKPIQLMKSKRVRCWTHRFSEDTSPSGEESWNSFLAGIFHLQSGDKVYVKLDSKKKEPLAPGDNLMGAFMIYPCGVTTPCPTQRPH